MGSQVELPPMGASVGSQAAGGPGAASLQSGAATARQYWDRAAARWLQLPPRQRNWAIFAAGLVALLVGGLLWSATRTEWRTLYAGLDPDDTRQMSQVLTQAQIPFDLAADGTAIRVPLAQLDKARLATAAKGGPRSGRLGFELFDKPNWVGSEFDEQVNYQRALEGELEHTVGTLEDVQSARVHLVLPHDSLFRDQERPAKASVVLKLRHRTLADGEDEAIRNLVASAVDGLSPSQVTLVDASGHLPLGPKTGEAMRQSMEDALEAKLIETLEPVTGSGNVRASVTVDYDPATTEVTEESYDPSKVVTLSMQRTEQISGPQAIPSGVPGTASNAPNSQALPVYPHETAPPQSAKSESGAYGASKTVRHVTQPSGHIRRLTAAILVNDRLQSGEQRNGQPMWRPRSAEEIRNLAALAQAAVGFDSNRGDVVTVQDLAFEDNRGPAEVSAMDRGLNMLERFPVLVKYGSIVVGFLLVILLAIRPAMAIARKPDAAMEKPAAELPRPYAQEHALPTSEEMALDSERQRVQRVFEQVTETLKSDPGQSSRLLQSWIHSD